MKAAGHATSRKQQQKRISEDPLKSPATDTAAAQPDEIHDAVERNRGGEGSAKHDKHGNRPPASNPNQPGSDTAPHDDPEQSPAKSSQGAKKKSDSASRSAASPHNPQQLRSTEVRPGTAGTSIEVALWAELADRSDPGSSLTAESVGRQSAIYAEEQLSRQPLPKDDD